VETAGESTIRQCYVADLGFDSLLELAKRFDIMVLNRNLEDKWFPGYPWRPILDEKGKRFRQM